VRDRNAQVNRVLNALEAAKKAPAPVVDVPAQPRAIQPVEAAPVLKPTKPTKPPEFDSIDKVSDAELQAALVGALTEFGTMEADDLIAAVSKRLGFKRTGPKIRDRIAGALNVLLGETKLAMTDDNRVKVTQPQ
jgi:hypothetical protein